MTRKSPPAGLVSKCGLNASHRLPVVQQAAQHPRRALADKLSTAGAKLTSWLESIHSFTVAAVHQPFEGRRLLSDIKQPDC